jgi:DNA-directed RNA polymerase specialized sigma subunit
MDLFERLTAKEQQILVQFYNEFTRSEVAIINQCTTKEVDRYCESIIAKFK